jgi:hypothetical protein
MSFRRSLSFADDEHMLVKEYDDNGGSRFAKEAMRFFIRYRDKMMLLPDGLSLAQRPQLPNTNVDIKSKALKQLKK